MMNDELKRLLVDAHSEEVNDHQKYIRMAEMAKQQGCDKAYRILMDISHEEETHKQMLAELLGM